MFRNQLADFVGLVLRKQLAPARSAEENCGLLIRLAHFRQFGLRKPLAPAAEPLRNLKKTASGAGVSVFLMPVIDCSVMFVWRLAEFPQISSGLFF